MLPVHGDVIHEAGIIDGIGAGHLQGVVYDLKAQTVGKDHGDALSRSSRSEAVEPFIGQGLEGSQEILHHGLVLRGHLPVPVLLQEMKIDVPDVDPVGMLCKDLVQGSHMVVLGMGDEPGVYGASVLLQHGDQMLRVGSDPSVHHQYLSVGASEYAGKLLLIRGGVCQETDLAAGKGGRLIKIIGPGGKLRGRKPRAGYLSDAGIVNG